MSLAEGAVEGNILVASWPSDMGLRQKPFDDRLCFYNNESLLGQQNLRAHFMSYNKNLFNDKNLRFSSKKGQLTNVSQDNFFCVVDGDTRVFGIFDGHGPNGHLVSNFVMG